jgi:hypothetical protein
MNYSFSDLGRLKEEQEDFSGEHLVDSLLTDEVRSLPDELCAWLLSSFAGYDSKIYIFPLKPNVYGASQFWIAIPEVFLRGYAGARETKLHRKVQLLVSKAMRYFGITVGEGEKMRELQTYTYDYLTFVRGRLMQYFPDRICMTVETLYSDEECTKYFDDCLVKCVITR